jgi:hypothetical protein
VQRLQNRVLRATGKLEMCPSVRKLQVAFKIPLIYDYITKLYREQAEVTLNNANPNARGIEK